MAFNKARLLCVLNASLSTLGLAVSTESECETSNVKCQTCMFLEEKLTQFSNSVSNLLHAHSICITLQSSHDVSIRARGSNSWLASLSSIFLHKTSSVWLTSVPMRWLLKAINQHVAIKVDKWVPVPVVSPFHTALIHRVPSAHNHYQCRYTNSAAGSPLHDKLQEDTKKHFVLSLWVPT